ncbi:MAG: oligosaccharide flippase family protein [Methanocellales archaeon]
MKIWIPRSKGEFKEHLRDPLYKNSFFIMLSSVSNAIFGFFFWMVAARLYPKSEVGVATALISSLSLLILFTRFGFPQSLIRFFPEMDRSRVFFTSVLITTLSAFLLGFFFILSLDFWSPGLAIARDYAAIYLIFLAISSISSLTAVAFIALRKAEFDFIQSVLMGFKILFLPLLVFLGALGIFTSIGLASLLSLSLSLFFLFKFGLRFSGLDRVFLNESFHFSIGNYIAGLLNSTPSLILPILVLNILGAEEAAHYYIAYAIGVFLFIIPGAFSTSLFVEGSYGEALRIKTLKSLFGVFLLLIPGVVVIYFFAGYLLDLIGRGYIVGLDLLRYIAFSSLFAVPLHIYISIKEVQRDVKALVSITFLLSLLLLSLSYFFMIKFGIVGVGIAWLISYGFCGLYAIIKAWREKWICW